MLDIDAQAELANATRALMRTCAVVTAQTMTASACRGLSLWSQLLRVPTAPATGAVTWMPETLRRASPANGMPTFGAWPLGAWPPVSLSGWDAYTALWGRPAQGAWGSYGDWASWSRAYWPAWSGAWEPEAVVPAVACAASPATYASYRSAGGHATAQVIMPATATVAVGLTTSAVFTQMQTALGLWRTALGV